MQHLEIERYVFSNIFNLRSTGKAQTKHDWFLRECFSYATKAMRSCANASQVWLKETGVETCFRLLQIQMRNMPRLTYNTSIHSHWVIEACRMSRGSCHATRSVVFTHICMLIFESYAPIQWKHLPFMRSKLWRYSQDWNKRPPHIFHWCLETSRRWKKSTT